MAAIQLYQSKQDCCGCGSCLDSCPKHAISMKADEYGFLYPVIDEKLCVSCGLCKKVCGYQNKTANAPIKAYAATAKSAQILQSAASGGVFSSLATAAVEQNGVVVGSSMEKQEDTLKAVHRVVMEQKDLPSLAGSKYVQSSTVGVFPTIKQLLEQDKLVLFSGTPCQVDALRAFLRHKTYKNLYTIDLICHGVPNEKMFSDYLAVNLPATVNSYIFRDKTVQWGLDYSYSYSYKGKNIERHYPSDMSSYYHHFLLGNTYRENCYSCKHACAERCGDITIGDFWGIEKEYPELVGQNGKIDPKKGVSCILVNTEQGQRLLEQFGTSMNLFEVEFDKIQKWNHQLKEPSQMGKQRSQVLELYKNGGWAEVEKDFEKRRGLKYKIKKIVLLLKNLK